MDQTPPEKMTLEQVIENLQQTESGLTYLAKIMWSEGESTEAVAMELYVRNVQSALLHLEGAQADKEKLNEHGLKDCPFCGGDDAQVDYIKDLDGWQACCQDCLGRTMVSLSPEWVKHCWNSRGHLESELPAMAAQTDGERP